MLESRRWGLWVKVVCSLGQRGQPHQDDDPRGTAAAGADLHPGGEGAQGRHRPRGARGRFQEADGKGIGNANPPTR